MSDNDMIRRGDVTQLLVSAPRITQKIISAIAAIQPDPRDEVIKGLVKALEYILDGYGLNAPDFKQCEYEEDGNLVPDDWIVSCVRAALAAAKAVQP